MPGSTSIYESILSGILDHAEERECEYFAEREASQAYYPETYQPERLRLDAGDWAECLMDCVDYGAAHEELARDYCQAFDRWTADNLATPLASFAFESMTSPRFYNFETDRVFVEVPFAVIASMGAPRLALVIDEAHLIFGEPPPALLSRVERIVRLIRSRGVALYFASQSPADIPAPILAQLGNRVQHGLRGATPADLRAIRAAADTMPINPAVDAGAEIVRLGVGLALVSVIGAHGVPSPVEIVQIAAPRATLAPVEGSVRAPFIPSAPPMPAAPPRRTSDAHPVLLIVRLGFAALALVWTIFCAMEGASSGDWSGFFVLWLGMPLFLMLRGAL